VTTVDDRVAPELLAAPVPIPAGRGRWRFTVHRRYWTSTDQWRQTIVGELTDARGRHLTYELNKPAELTFTIDGDSSQAPLVVELGSEIVAWRWDEQVGRDRPMFQGIVDHSEDQVTEQSAVVTFVAHDRLAMLDRRILRAPLVITQTDQDNIASQLVTLAQYPTDAAGQNPFTPGAFLDMVVNRYAPDGTTGRGLSGQIRDRTYAAGTTIGEALDQLSAVAGGFDYDCAAEIPGSTSANPTPWVRIFYPSQGVTRSDMALQYGSTVSAFTRTVSSADYANHVRVIGNNSSSDAAAPQVYAEVWNDDANNVTVNPVGLWSESENASDVSIQSTLNETAAGILQTDGLLVPSYTVTLRPDAYRYGFPNMGDTVPFLADVGRLDVNTTIRVVGISYDVNDDDDENVDVTVGRPPTTLARLFNRSQRNVDQLARR